MLIPVRTSLTDREKERHLSDSCLSAIGKTAASKHTNYIMTVRTLARKLGHYSFHYYKTTSPLLPAAAPACWCAILIASSYTGQPERNYVLGRFGDFSERDIVWIQKRTAKCAMLIHTYIIILKATLCGFRQGNCQIQKSIWQRATG